MAGPESGELVDEGTRSRQDDEEERGEGAVGEEGHVEVEEGPKIRARELILKMAARPKMGKQAATSIILSKRAFLCISRCGCKLRCLSARTLLITSTFL